MTLEAKGLTRPRDWYFWRVGASSRVVVHRLDSYQPIPKSFRPSQPIYPRAEGSINAANENLTKESTFTASYVKHPVKRFVPAKKPQGALDGYGVS